MKDIITKSQKSSENSSVYIIRAAAIHIIMAAVGFTVSKTVIFEDLMPFGLVFSAACLPDFIASITTGAFIGYFIPAVGVGGFRYIAALLAIVAIRLMLSSYKKVAENPLFLSLISAAATAITGAVTYSGAALDGIKFIGETLIVAATVFLVNRTFYSIWHNIYGLSAEELSYLLITITIIITGIGEFSLFGISLGKAISVLLILAAAKYGGTLASAVCGIALSFSSALTASFEGGAGIYSFMGLFAGLFASLGKYAQVAAVLTSGIIGLSFMGFKTGGGIFIAEIIVGCIIFLFLPRSAGIALGKIFYSHPKIKESHGSSNALTMRLRLASNALCDVSKTVTEVSRELAKINTPEFKSVLAFIEQDACSGCKLRLHCWETKKDGTVDAIMQLINLLKENSVSVDNELLEDFKGRCIRIKKMEDAVERRYFEYSSVLAAENRIEQVRQVVSDQFEGVSNMLSELAQDFADDEQFDNCAASLAAAALKNIGILAEECSARIDKFGRMMLEIRVRKNQETIYNRLQIMKALSLACERDFDVPNINRVGDNILITACEHAVYKIDFGVCQQIANGYNMCGDAYRSFNDGKGHFVMVLSDGMGTGGRAAVDGAMASGLISRLIKAGFGFDCSLKILNSSMLFKSTDESLATLDIASIDLFTGATELYKAGAAPTLVRRSGRVGRAESTSLPVGILRDISFDRAAIKLKHNDILILVSDGATCCGTEWIRAELESWRDGSAQDLADRICQSAYRRHTEPREDDITVMVAIIEKSV